MDAIVSGSANLAILLDGESLLSLHVTTSGVERRPRRPHELRYILGDARDLAFLEDVDEESVLCELDLSHAGVEALHLALMLCDPTTSERASGLAAGEIEALLARLAVAERAERILYAKPMAAPFAAGIAAARCRAHGRVGAAAFFEALGDAQPTIREVRRAWDVLPRSLFADGDERAFADGVFAREGLFRALVRVRRAKASVDAWFAEAVKSPAMKQWRAERWLAAWVEEIRGAAPDVATFTAAPATPAEVSAKPAPAPLDARFKCLRRDPRKVAEARALAGAVARRRQVMCPAA